MTLAPMLVDAMADETYHADPCDEPSLSSSIARVLCTMSPLHAWTAHPRLNPDFVPVEAEKFDIGTAAHDLLLRGIDNVVVVNHPDWRTNAAKELRDSARAEQKIPLLAKHYDAVCDMVNAARLQLDQHAAKPTPFMDGKAEQTLIWDDDGVMCRARLDWIHDSRDGFAVVIDDYKTTSRSANPESWSRTLYGMGYDVQAAFYLRGMKVFGFDSQFRWTVQETMPPYALSVNALTPAALELADAKVQFAVDLWRKCMADNVWPGYPTEVCYAELPGWEEARWLEKEEREAA